MGGSGGAVCQLEFGVSARTQTDPEKLQTLNQQLRFLPPPGGEQMRNPDPASEISYPVTKERTSATGALQSSRDSARPLKIHSKVTGFCQKSRPSTDNVDFGSRRHSIYQNRDPLLWPPRALGL